MKKDSNIGLCGQVAVYNEDIEYPPSLPKEIQQFTRDHNITRQRFVGGLFFFSFFFPFLV